MVHHTLAGCVKSAAGIRLPGQSQWLRKIPDRKNDPGFVHEWYKDGRDLQPPHKEEQYDPAGPGGAL